MATFFTSDHHFGDHRRLAIDQRPFGSVAEQDREMAARWNATVSPTDTVWHLGDLTRHRDPARVDALLSGLSGVKHLVSGNNDGPATLAWSGWASVAAYAEIEVDGYALVLCHYAFRTWNGMARGAIDLHGHSHGRLAPIRRQVDVGVDAWDFRPVTLAEAIERSRMRGRQRQRG
ncbi:MAG: metallophosphoesterase [Methylobacteriaceae bacterium]|nr:metallophosphoesterase [Methylobacteriaceae bacterium]